ncbi:MAG TPA: S-layer homology domain-containing protein [Acidimicrobiales bacterium]
MRSARTLRPVGSPPGRRRRLVGAAALLAVVAGLGGGRPADAGGAVQSSADSATATSWQPQAELVSTNGAGTDSGDAPSWAPRLSPDGTKVVFHSLASDLGPTDTNGEWDVYVRDLTTGTTSLVSVNVAGADSGDERSYFPWFSPDGSQVIFRSRATDLTSPGGGGRVDDLYIRDLDAGTTTLVSVNADGTGGGDATSGPGFVSPDAATVVFASAAGDLAPSDSEAQSGVFERDLASGVTTRLADGEYATYSPSGDTIGYLHDGEVYLRDRATGATTSVSSGLPSETHDNGPIFSHDGTRVAFGRRNSSGLIISDIYVYDRATGTTELVTRAASGSGGSDNTPSRVQGFHPTDPDLVLFTSTATNLVPGGTSPSRDQVYVRDLARDRTTLVSTNGAGTASAGGSSTSAAWVGDGRRVAMVTTASDLGPRDTNTYPDIYVRDMTSGTYALVSANAAGDNAGTGRSGQYDAVPPHGSYIDELSVSADGSLIAFGSDAGDLGPVDSDRGSANHDVYVATSPPPALFTDVPHTHPFFDDIGWLVDEGIATGYADGTFRGAAAVSRQAMAAFLYRAAGSPLGADPSCGGAPFGDVPTGHPFCGEIAWMAGEGIAAGYSDGTFRPADPISRQAIAAFLFRWTGQEEGDTCAGTEFSDVTAAHPFCPEIAWLADTGITTGYPDGTFRPGAVVTRQATAAFLHRLLGAS